MCKESVLQVCKRSHLRESHDLPVGSITFASIQMVEQNVEETDTSEITTKSDAVAKVLFCSVVPIRQNSLFSSFTELIMSDRACSDECVLCKKTEFTLDIFC